MTRESIGASAPEDSSPILHRAARIEDAFHHFREVRARKRGLQPTIIPYTGYGGHGWVRVLARVLLTKPVAPDDKRPTLDRSIRGWRSFTSVPVTSVQVTITAGGTVHRVAADRGGVIDTTVNVELAPGWNTIQLQTENSDPVEAPVYVIGPNVEFGLLSDIDDTVMVTALPRPLLAAWNTFVLDEHARTPVAGMAVLYERITRAHPGTPVIYLSTGAWNVAPTLSRFLSRNLYPVGPLLLTDWGPTHDRLFRSGRQHKRESLSRLAADFPAMKWVLVGDDGQHDVDLYGEFSREHEENVAAVCIRQLSNGEAVFAGGRSDNSAHDSRVPWLYAPDGAGLSELLTSIDLLPASPSDRHRDLE